MVESEKKEDEAAVMVVVVATAAVGDSVGGGCRLEKRGEGTEERIKGERKFECVKTRLPLFIIIKNDKREV